MPFTPFAGVLGKKRAAHLLRRACTGASLQDIETFAGYTATQAFQALYIEDLPIPTAPIDPATGSEWITNGAIEDVNSDNLSILLNSWIVGQMLASGVDPSLQLAYRFKERLTFFMHTHFTTKSSKTTSTRYLYHQNALFRHYAFDANDIESSVENPDSTPEEPLPPEIYSINFKELTKKISLENAMLWFLDGRLNVSGNPNENYARELLELYTIGRGLEGEIPATNSEGDYFYYTEEDVQAAAKVLSGFNVEYPEGPFINIDLETGIPRGVLRSGGTQHDITTKVFSSRFDNATIGFDADLIAEGATTEELIIDEIGQLVDLIYTKDETAIHICRKLYRFFFYHEVTLAIQDGIISDMAQIFKDNEFKIAPVLEALFTSTEFYDGATGYDDDIFGSIIKSPLDLTVGFINNFGINVPNYATEVDNFYIFMEAILSSMGSQGMDFYDPFEVAGYSAYHQYPIYNRSWITTNYLTNRYNFVNNRVTPGDLIEIGDINPLQYVQNNIADSIARDARLLIIELIENFLPMSTDVSFEESATSELTQDRMSYFLNSFLDTMDADPEAAWTANWDGQSDMEKADNQLANLFNALLQTPEYQLM